MAADNIDLAFLAKLARDNLAELKEMRREVTDVRRLALQTVDVLRKMEQRLDARMTGLDARMVAVRDDVELMIKSEIMGSLAYRDSIVEQKLDGLEARIAELEVRA